MRIAVDVLGVEADDVQQFLDPLGPLAARNGVRVDAEGLADDVSDRHTRIQRGVRILEDDLDVTAQLAHLRSPEVGGVTPLEGDRPGGRWLEGHQQPSQGGLSAAGLPDDTEGLAGVEIEAHTVDGLDMADGVTHHPGLQRVMLGEVAN